MDEGARTQPSGELMEEQWLEPVFPAADFGPLLIGGAFAASLLVVLAGVALGVPSVAVAPLVWLPFLPMFWRLGDWTVRHYGTWIAFFLVFMLLQLGHFGEHIAQMVQIHIIGLAPADAHGIVGELDIEWVHFIWNTLVFVAAAVLLSHFGKNPWLWLTAVVAVWHLTEHVAIMSVFWDTGIAGDPGLLSMGGSIFGGLGISRPDLHFLYNVVETLPLVAAYVYALQRASVQHGTRLQTTG